MRRHLLEVFLPVLLALAAGRPAAAVGEGDGSGAASPSRPVPRSLWEPRLRELVAAYDEAAFRLSSNRTGSFSAFYWPKYDPSGPRDRDLRHLFGKASVVVSYRRDSDEIRHSVDPANVKGAAFFREVGALFREAIPPASFERYEGQRGTVHEGADRAVATFAPVERWPDGLARPRGAHTVVVFGANRAPVRFEEYDSRERLIETREYTHARVRDSVAVQSYTITPASIDPAADRRTIRIAYGAESEGDVFPERLEFAFTRRGLGAIRVLFVLRGVDRDGAR